MSLHAMLWVCSLQCCTGCRGDISTRVTTTEEGAPFPALALWDRRGVMEKRHWLHCSSSLSPGNAGSGAALLLGIIFHDIPAPAAQSHFLVIPLNYFKSSPLLWEIDICLEGLLVSQ